MSLPPGARLGPYMVATQIGVGGMGEVYRATDTNLGRQVAIKVLPEAVAQDGERLARFDREARTLAALNHPNIAAIYGLERTDGTIALVMELVEGPTLADRIAQGAIPVDEALAIAKQIAEALEAAHEQGIIHRDLKPANIKVRPDGTVKVLDFGLAKAMEPTGGMSASVSMSPTITTPAMTQMGMILGTAAYMSPEQARGKPVDKRADIWAFGCVMFEMLTGKRAFDGEDVSETLALVINGEPHWEALPTEWRLLVRSCLERSPQKRLRDIGDVWRLLDTRPAEPTVEVRRLSPGWIAAGVLLLALAGLASVHFREAPIEGSQPFHLSIALPGEGDEVRSLALSPDGRTVVTAASIAEQYQLWVRDLDETEFRPLAGTTLARVPFWSPDSRSIGFFADQKLKTVAATGGPPRELCDAGLGNGGTWNRDGVILFAPNGTGAIYRVSATGGECAALTTPEPGSAHVLPEFLDDGRHFFYVVMRGEESKRGVYVAALDSPQGRRVLGDESSVTYVPPRPGEPLGLVLFLRDDTLLAQRFDPARLEMVGEEVSIARPVSRSNTAPQAAVSASLSGTLVYLTNSLTGRDLQLVWMDRNGRELGSVGAPGNLSGHSLSPDQRSAAVSVRSEVGTTSDLWIYDLVRATTSRFTAFSGSTSAAAAWSPDGRRIIFSGLRSGSASDGLYGKDIGGAPEQLVLGGDTAKRPSDWSRDGRYVIYTDIGPTTGADIWILPDPLLQSAERKGLPFAQTPYAESHGRVSPDGRWMAYSSTESGDEEIYIRPFPTGDGVWRVSTAGGREPQWRADGRELYYVDGVLSRRWMTAVPMRFTSEPVMGAPERLFEFRTNTGVLATNWFSYAATGDGQRFLVSRYADNVQPTIDVLPNWRPNFPTGEQP